jgi:purine nucleosidase
MSNFQAQELILLDTDIGSDIDDALALAYLIKQPKCKLLGVTTVSGEPHLRASIVDSILQQTGHSDISVHVGAEAPLLRDQNQPRAPHYDVISARSKEFPHKAFAPTLTAIDFLRQTIREHPGQITLLAIGPLTNIALLFKVDPEIPSLLKRLVIMGGQHTAWTNAYKSVAEWNILCDPHAAAIVFASDVKLTAVGLEVTTRCRLDSDQCRKSLEMPGVPTVLMPMAAHWLGHQKYVTFHDPLAAALIFEPEFCKLERGLIEVETVSAKASGMTHWTSDPLNGKHYAASSVDSDAFFAHYFDILST